MTAKTVPAPPPMEIFASGTAMDVGGTIPCAPPIENATMRPAPWEYAPVSQIPRSPALPPSRLPTRSMPVGLLVLAVGALSFAVVAGLRLSASAPVAQPEPPAPAASHVFVDVDAIVVRPPSQSSGVAVPVAVPVAASAPSAQAAAGAGLRDVGNAAPVDDIGVAPLMPASAALTNASQGPAGSQLRARFAPSATPALRRAHRSRRVRARETGSLNERAAAPSHVVASELDAAVVGAVVARQQRRLERCYERALTRAGVARAETLRLTVHITPQGSVAVAEARGASVPALASCLEGVALGWAFPASRSGAEVPIPLRFTPQG